MEKIIIRTATIADIKALESFSRSLGAASDSYFVHQLEKQNEGARVVVVAEEERTLKGYGILNWQPKYNFFKKMGFPEIQDLNVHPDARQRGIATRIINHCEELARKNGQDYMGIGVGLHKGFGPAQRLYVKLGYIPDGYGLNYDREPIRFGEFRPVDDDLCLMMVKVLEKGGKTAEK